MDSSLFMSRTGGLSSSGGLASPSGQHKKSKFKVLGDISAYSTKYNELTLPPPPPEQESVHNIDAETLGAPEEVWRAASMSPDGGAVIIRAYREVVNTRQQYKSQLSNIYMTRAAKTEMLSSPSRTGTLKGTLKPLPKGTLASLATATLATHIHEAVKDGSSTRAMGTYEGMRSEWESGAAQLSSVTGRPDYELAMQRGPLHRTKIEALDAIEQAMPIQDRIGGEEMWRMSLRDAWERVVPIGNMFNGLSAVVKAGPASPNKAQNLQRIGRPLDAESTLLPVPKSTVFTTSLGVAPRGGTLGPGAFNPDGTVKAHTLKSLGTKGARSLALRNRDWTCSEALQQHAATYAKNLRKLYPHDPDQRSLLLTGQALETQLESLAYSPIVLEEVEALLAHTEPEAFAAYAEVKMRLGQEAHAAYEAELAAQEEAAAAAAAAGPQPGPHVRLPVAALALTVGGGNVDGALQLEKPSAASAIATFSLVHRGTAAFRYTWEPVAPSLPPFSAAQASTPPGFNPPSGLSLSQSSGALLPGETAEFGVVFRPPNGTPGVYTQAWALVTQPPLAHSASEGGPIVFTATGLCTPSDESGEERRAMADELAVAERTRKVHAALNRVLADITPPPPPRRPEPIPDEVAVQQAAFDAANAGSFPPVFYSPEAYAQLEALYGEAMGALAAACAPAEDAVPAKGKAAPKKGKDADPPPPSARAYPDQWDASLSSLSALIHDVWKAGAPPPAGDGPPQPGPHADAADAMRARLAALAAAAKVPPDARVLLRHAARAMLVSVVEAMVDKLAGVESEYSTRLSEQEAVQAEAVEAAGGGDPPALPPGSVDSVWRSDRLRAEAKKHLKGPGGVAAGLFDAVGAGRVASGDALMLTLAGLDARIEAAAGSGSGSGDGEAVEGLQWERFAALRHWGRLGVPARPPYVLTGEAGEPEGKVAEGGKGGGKGAGGAKLKAGVSPAKKGTPKKGTAKKK